VTDDQVPHERGECFIDVPEAFRAYLDVAIARFQVLHPGVLIEHCHPAIRISEVGSLGASNAQRELLHLLYRERIYTETLPMRHSLLRALTQK
jgi:hypothetical protein